MEIMGEHAAIGEGAGARNQQQLCQDIMKRLDGMVAEFKAYTELMVEAAKRANQAANQANDAAGSAKITSQSIKDAIERLCTSQVQVFDALREFGRLQAEDNRDSRELEKEKLSLEKERAKMNVEVWKLWGGWIAAALAIASSVAQYLGAIPPLAK